MLRAGRSKEKGRIKRSFELCERTAASAVSRKVVPNKGSLERDYASVLHKKEFVAGFI